MRPRRCEKYSAFFVSPRGASGIALYLIESYQERILENLSLWIQVNTRYKRKGNQKMKKIVTLLLTLSMLLAMAACASAPEAAPAASQADETTAANTVSEETAPERRVITDGMDRKVEIPYSVERIVCVGVGALRYTCYVGGADRVVGVEDYETKPGMSRLYNYVNFDLFQDLPVTGTNGEPFVEEIINVDPQVIVMSSYASQDPEELSQKTGIPVVVVPGSDTTLDEKAYITIRILGELYQLEDRAEDLTAYLKSIQKDLNDRTASIAEDAKPTCYVGGVSFKGHHGFEGTEAYYGPFELIHAKNLANTTDQTGAFNIDVEQVLSWDPEIIFLDFNGMNLINEDYAAHPEFYNALTAVQEGKVYSQISFRSSASNLETALADAYYAACVMYPQQFQDIDPVEKAGEIFTKLLGSNPYHDLEEAGYAFCQITLGA